MTHTRSAIAALGPTVLALALALGACGPTRPPVVPPPEPSPLPTPEPTPSPVATPLPVKRVQGEVIVSAWSEPKHLPPGGGQAQIMVRLQKRGGAPWQGVEVRLQTSSGSLYSRSKILTTDAAGTTRDRLTARRTANITVNAGGTLYRFQVPVATE
jgi:hypothetical protein